MFSLLALTSIKTQSPLGKLHNEGRCTILERILLLLPTTTYRTEDFIEAASRLDVEVTIGANEKHVSMNPKHPEYSILLDFDTSEYAAKQIEDFHKTWPLSAIIPSDDRTAVVAALAAKSLQLPHNPPKAVLASMNKALLRKKLHAKKVRTPLASVFSIEKDPHTLVEDISFPCVLKPLILSASRGVIRANTPEEFCQAFLRIRKILNEPDIVKRGKDSRFLLVESFISGVEVALEGLLQQGVLHTLAIFDKPDPLEGPFFEETLYITPSRLSLEVQNAIETLSADACKALGLCEGPIHAELRIDKEGNPWLIELAARSIGGLCSRTLRFGTGLSLEDILIRYATKKPIVLERENRAAGVMMLPIQKEGILQDVLGKEEATAIEGIESLVISRPIGQKVIPLPEGSSYLGFLFARANDPDTVEQILRESFQKLRFIIDT